jgi:hypothetical protein
MIIAQSFFHCYSAQPFFAATVLIHSSCKKELSHFFDATVLCHFSLLQYSAIFHCCSTWPFPVLQYSTIPRYNSVEGSLVNLQNDQTRLWAREHDSRLGRGCTGPSRAWCRVARDRAVQGAVGRLVRLLGQVMDHGSITLSDE